MTTSGIEDAPKNGSMSPSYRRDIRGWRGLVKSQGLQITILLSALIVLGCQLRIQPVDLSQDTPVNLTLLPPAHLHILIPASRPDVNLCKVLLSASVLGYPSPVIINWNQEFNDNSLVEGGSHLAKISGIYDYVSDLAAAHDNDLVLMLDGYDVWLQLRAQTLLDRYYHLNRLADTRIHAEMGSAANETRQEIIFGCQKRCWPWTPQDPPCYAVPNSTLPKNVYGSRTDTLATEDNPFINYRPRFLNSGTAIGPVKAMRKLFGQALKQARDEPNIGSDQYIFSHIFGDQEIWREAIGRDAILGQQRTRSGPKQGLRGREFFIEEHISEVRAKAAEREDGNFEFGIGVDYGAEIVLNTVFAEEDTAWLAFSNRTQIVQASLEHADAAKSVKFLADDIASTLPPFWTSSTEDLPRTREWQNISLLTDIYTGNTPVVVHHNAHRDNLKSRRESWWPLTWFYVHARTLLDISVYNPLVALAVSGYDKSSRRQWWAFGTWKGGARDGSWKAGDEGEGWLRFDDICREYHEEIFGDDRGPWELPVAH
ncbi:hypothetical protein LTR78_006246 [Recurvomyces mirabilis]|uniref:Uncharacterized protein n=1 Tax=Recurvomyces mirabilis TaxID=574656 RepID=A0AAE0WLQ1_9PEZI|nr:hypothetical protein LTR78_006246 [Recurvomyces mirabilis]KAK5152087.1 hypothetical protein LTS14_008862 [Recurvomyces mirabilis]